MSVEDPHPLVPTVVLYDIMSEAATRLRGTLIAIGEGYHSLATQAVECAEQFQQAGDNRQVLELLDIDGDFNDLAYETLTYRLAVDELVDEVDPDDRAKILWATEELRAELVRRDADHARITEALADLTQLNPAGGGR